jgi:hypothetical protein
MEKSYIFISYRSSDPDRGLAGQFRDALTSAGHDVFMAGESIRIGDDWSAEIDAALEKCDCFTLLLSRQSIASDMVLAEVRRAKELRDQSAANRPRLFVVRVNYPLDGRINYDLAGYLSRFQQREWSSEDDTKRIVDEILELIGSGDDLLEQPLPIHTHNAAQYEIEGPPLPVAEPELPQGQVDLASPYYVERPPVDLNCYEAVVKPGALLRIKAPRQMGKTSLMARTLFYASSGEAVPDEYKNVRREAGGYEAVSLSFQLADAQIFSDLDQLLQWMCSTVAWKLDMADRVDEFWKLPGSKIRCTAYFEKYLLSEFEKQNKSLVLGLDEVDLVFGNLATASNFFGLLRAWNELAKSKSLWKRLRLVIVHSTEVYIPLEINESPFNVGTGVELPEFVDKQVMDLAKRHGLAWSIAQVNELMEMLGGHPYLVRVALYHIARQEMGLADLLESAITDAGVFGDHLRRHLWNLEKNPELADAMREVCSTTYPTELRSDLAFKLDSLGLVQLKGNNVVPRCKLYRLYFAAHLKRKK